MLARYSQGMQFQSRLLSCALFAAWCPAQTGYQKPSKEILEVLHAPVTPSVSVNPTRTHMLLLDRVPNPPIADVAAPMLRLAGVRIDPAANGPHRPQHYTGVTVKRISDGSEFKVATPAGARWWSPDWSADGKRFTLTNATRQGTELWVGSIESPKLRRIDGVRLNATLGDPVHWMPDSKSLLATVMPADRGPEPKAAAAPPGPNIQETTGKSGPMRTWQDMLGSPADEAVFDYHATSQVALVDAEMGSLTRLGTAGLYDSLSASPDGNYILLTRIKRPYSYLHPYFEFPRELQVWDRKGKLAYRVADLPLSDRVPIEGVPTGPRDVHWHPVEAATLLWLEALDEGDPRKDVPHRDKLISIRAPFQGQPAEMYKTGHRFVGLTWTEKGGRSLVTDYDRDRRWARTFLVNMDSPARDTKELWSRNLRERYKHPGSPVTRRLPNGHSVLHQSGDFIYTTGQGATPEGDRPFLDRVNLQTFATERLFRSDADVYEEPVALLSEDGSRFLTSRESSTQPPNFYVRSSQGMRALTKFPDPTPQLRKIKKELVTFKRADGVDLSFTLYLPPDYREGQRLPSVLYSYPLEYTDPQVAGQVSGSPNRFTRFPGASHLYFLLAGYVVLNDATLPVVGDPETVNNTYIEQIVSGAGAAIDKAAEMGVTDRNRVGVKTLFSQPLD